MYSSRPPSQAEIYAAASCSRQLVGLLMVNILAAVGGIGRFPVISSLWAVPVWVPRCATAG